MKKNISQEAVSSRTWHSRTVLRRLQSVFVCSNKHRVCTGTAAGGKYGAIENKSTVY